MSCEMFGQDYSLFIKELFSQVREIPQSKFADWLRQKLECLFCIEAYSLSYFDSDELCDIKLTNKNTIIASTESCNFIGLNQWKLINLIAIQNPNKVITNCITLKGTQYKSIGLSITIGHWHYVMCLMRSQREFSLKEQDIFLLFMPIFNELFRSCMLNFVDLSWAQSKCGNIVKKRDSFEIIEAMTQRKREVCHQLIQGKTDKQIGRILGISPNTVSNHLKEVYKLLQVQSRSEAIALLKRFD